MTKKNEETTKNRKKITKQNNETNKKIIYSTIFSLSFIKEFSILKSDNLKETCTYLIKFFEKIN